MWPIWVLYGSWTVMVNGIFSRNTHILAYILFVFFYFFWWVCVCGGGWVGIGGRVLLLRATFTDNLSTTWTMIATEIVASCKIKMSKPTTTTTTTSTTRATRAEKPSQDIQRSAGPPWMESINHPWSKGPQLASCQATQQRSYSISFQMRRENNAYFLGRML